MADDLDHECEPHGRHFPPRSTSFPNGFNVVVLNPVLRFRSSYSLHATGDVDDRHYRSPSRLRDLKSTNPNSPQLFLIRAYHLHDILVLDIGSHPAAPETTAGHVAPARRHRLPRVIHLKVEHLRWKPPTILLPILTHSGFSLLYLLFPPVLRVYGVEHKLGHVEFVEEAEFGLEDLENRNLCDLLEKLRSGDTLLVSDIHRLGQSTVEILGVFLKILRRGAAVCAFDGQYDLGSEPTFRGIPCILSLLTLSLKELELRESKLSTNKKRIDGTAAIWGRPAGRIGVSRLSGKDESIKSMLAEGLSKTAIARELNISRPALHDYIVSRKLIENS